MASRKKTAEKVTKGGHLAVVGRDPVSQLYRAIVRYIESGKGKILVIGGIEIQEWPGDPAYTYRVAVKITGRKPAFAQDKSKVSK